VGPEPRSLGAKDTEASKAPLEGEQRVESESAGPEHGSERRRFRRYRMSIPVWLSYGHNYHETDSGRVRDFSRAGIFLVTDGARDLTVGDVVKVNATFTVRSEARVVRVEGEADGPRGVALEFLRELELDI